MTVINSNVAETLNISENGTYDVSNYTGAVVNTPAAPSAYIPRTKNGTKIEQSSDVINLNGITDIGSYALMYSYYARTQVARSVDFSDLRHISGAFACSNMFWSCHIPSVDLSSLIDITGGSACESMFKQTYLSSVNMDSLTSITGQGSCMYMFQACTYLTSVNFFPSLMKIKSNNACSSMFISCTALTSADLGKLVAADGNNCLGSMFNNCTSLTNLDLSSLKYLNGNTPCNGMLKTCTALTTLSFPALKTAASTSFSSMLQGVTGCTVHFPSNMSSYAFSVGGTNTTVLYDLPATNILTGANSVNYERNPKYDTATALAWRVEDTGTAPDFVVDWTPFYTSGLTDPTVGTTIYSDAECTTSVTTVASIS